MRTNADHVVLAFVLIESEFMSFDIVYQPCQLEAAPVEKKNPFTGEAQTYRPARPLSPADLKAVRVVIERADASAPDEFGCRIVRFGDGREVEIHAGEGLETGCLVVLRDGLSPALARFLFDLLRAADWIMLPAMEGNPAIAALPGRAKVFSDDFPEVVCNSAEELRAALGEGRNDWDQYKVPIIAD